MAIYRGTGSASTTSDQATIDEVTTQATNAANSATSAASSASSAASSASSASSSASTATSQASAASTSATSAASSASSASTSASNASTSATNAATSATSASSSATAAATARTNAETAQAAAETAQTAAETAETNAETAQTAAETALASTQAVYDDFDDRYLGAKASDPTVDNDGDALIDGALYFDTTNAQMKVYDLSGATWEAFSLTANQLTDVNTVATNIADVTSVADNMADVQAAQTSATNAANSATASANSATASANSATASAASATAAASSAASAATALDSFDDRYLGAKASAPTTDNDGDPLLQGALYYDTTQGSMYVYEGSAWIKASASIVDTWNEYVYTATNAQTAFTGADNNTNTLVTSDYMIVTRNGIRLTLGVGYTVTTGTVTLTTAANTGDIITITVLAPLQVADTLSLSQGGTVTGAVTFSGNVDGIAFSEIDSTPTTLAGYGITDAATSAQGALADSATQPGDLATVATTGAYSDLTGSPTAVSSFTNDAGYITGLAINGISDVTITTPADNEVLAYDNTSSTWINQTAAEAGIATTTDIANSANWDTAYGWGDHSTQNYATTTGDTMTGALNFGDNVKAQFGAGNDLQIYHDGSNSWIDDQGTGSLVLTTNGASIVLQNGLSETMIKANVNGESALYYDNSKKLATTVTGVSVTGDFTASGNVTAYSDKRLKTDVATIEDALDKVNAMRGVTYIKDGELSSGVIAQELQQVAPELVIDGEYLSVAYGNLVGYLIEAVKELKAEVEELKGAK